MTEEENKKTDKPITRCLGWYSVHLEHRYWDGEVWTVRAPGPGPYTDGVCPDCEQALKNHSMAGG